MKHRFVRLGGWERAIDLGDQQPLVYKVAKPVEIARSWNERAPQKQVTLEALVFERTAFVNSRGEPEEVYVERGMTSSEVDCAESPALIRSWSRIDHLERLCEQANAVLSETIHGYLFYTVVTRGRVEHVDGAERIKKELEAVAVTSKARRAGAEVARWTKEPDR